MKQESAERMRPESNYLMEVNEAVPPLTSALYLTKQHKRLYELTPDDCGDARTFQYGAREIWNGF